MNTRPIKFILAAGTIAAFTASAAHAEFNFAQLPHPSLILSSVGLHDDPSSTASAESKSINDSTQPEKTADDNKNDQPERPISFGLAGSDWLTIGTFAAYDFDEEYDFNLHAAWSRFIVDDLEFAVEAAIWYFDQKDDDTGGLSGSFYFRYHFLHADDYRWSIFADAGMGLLFGFDNVPQGGTGFNFLQRIGCGFTYALNDSVEGQSRGPRLISGLRWHHISNGRIEGDGRNPARDSIAFYIGFMIPF